MSTDSVVKAGAMTTITTTEAKTIKVASAAMEVKTICNLAVEMEALEAQEAVHKAVVASEADTIIKAKATEVVVAVVSAVAAATMEVAAVALILITPAVAVAMTGAIRMMIWVAGVKEVANNLATIRDHKLLDPIMLEAKVREAVASVAAVAMSSHLMAEATVATIATSNRTTATTR